MHKVFDQRHQKSYQFALITRASHIRRIILYDGLTQPIAGCKKYLVASVSKDLVVFLLHIYIVETCSGIGSNHIIYDTNRMVPEAACY